MSVGVHADVNGNLTISAPGPGHSSSNDWTDADLFLDYGGPYVPLGTPVLQDIDDNSSAGSLVNSPGIYLPSPGFNLDIESYYNSNSSYNGPFGFGQTITSNIILRTSLTVPTVVEIAKGNGQVVSYLDDGCGNYAAQTAGLLNTLEQDVENSLWLETTPDGRTMAFPLNLSGKRTPISWAEDSVGNRHTFNYTDDRLTGLQDAVGRTAQFRYASSGMTAPSPTHLLSEIEDWAGHITTFTYDKVSVTGKPLLSSVTGAAGYQVQYLHDDKGRRTSVQDANSVRTTYAYDSNYRVTGRTITGIGATTYSYTDTVSAITDPLGAVATHTLNDKRRLVDWQGPHGTAYSFARNAHQQETIREDAHGNTWLTVYNEEGVPIGTTNPRLQVTTITRDDFNNPRTVSHYDGAVEEMIWTGSFDPTGAKSRMQEHVDALGNHTSYQYNSRGQITKVLNAVGKATDYDYDSNGNRTSMTDWLGNATHYTLDSAGNVTVMTDPMDNDWDYTYDGQNRRLTTTDPKGRMTTTTYDNVGNVTSQTNEWGGATSYEYNAWDDVKKVTNALSQITTTLYDTVGRPVTNIDALNRISTTVYDLAGRPVAAIDPLNHITTTIYDQTGLVTATVNYLGFTTTYVNDEIGRVQEVIDPLTHTTTTEYDLLDAPGQPAVRSIDAVGNITTTVYDLDRQQIANVDQYGHRNTTVYDAIGRTIETEDALHQKSFWTYDLLDGGSLLQTTFENANLETTLTTYDANGRAIQVENALGEITATVYDEANRVVATVDPKGAITTTTYDIFDGASRASKVEDPLNYVTITVYDALQRGVATVNPRGERTTSIYDNAGQLTEVVDSLNHRTTTIYDDAGRVTESIDQLGNRTTTVYDQKQNSYPATKTIDPLGHVTTMVSDQADRGIASIDASGARTSTVYDEADRPVANIDALGRITTSVYDQMQDGYPASVSIDAIGRRSTVLYDSTGQAIAEIDVLGNRTSYVYDAVGNLRSVQDAEGRFTTFTYDALGQRIAVMDANGHTTTTVYDERGLVSATYDPLAHETAYSYNNDGDLVYRRDARGLETNYLRDSLGLVHVVEYETGARVTYVYDWDNRVQAQADTTGITTYAYDPASQVTQVYNPNGLNVGYSLDAFGNRYSMADPNGGLTQYGYDSRALLNKIANPYGEVTTLSYDSVGRENYRQMANGVIVEREWDDLGREWKLQQRLGSTMLGRYTMTYDQVGTNLRQQVAELDGSITTYLYDKTYQLVNEHRTGTEPFNITYTYDSAGNRLVMNEDSVLTTYTYDNANRLATQQTPATLTTFSYDPNGNLTVENAAGNRTTYTWDEENRLTGITLPGGSTETYIYRADGMRQRKISGAKTTDFVRDGQNVLLETTVDTSTTVPGVTQQQFTDYPGAWGGLVSVRQVLAAWQDEFNASPFNTIQFNQPQSTVIPVTSRYYSFDQSGNTRLLTDGVGTPTDSYLTTAFGKEVAHNGTSINPFRYGGQTGYYRDSDDRLYVRARHLDVGAGKWMSSDPIGFDGGNWNLYRNVANNPINESDPSGLQSVDRIFGAQLERGLTRGYNDILTWIGLGKTDPELDIPTWIDKNLMFSSVEKLGTVTGQYDSGQVSGWRVVGAGIWAGANLVLMALDVAILGKTIVVGVKVTPSVAAHLVEMKAGKQVESTVVRRTAMEIVEQSPRTVSYAAARRYTQVGHAIIEYRLVPWKGKFAFLSKLGFTRAEITSTKLWIHPALKGEQYAEVAIHESTHILLARKIPTLPHAKKISYFGSFVRYGEELVTYSRAAWLTGRYDRVIIAPVSAVRSLKNGDKLNLGGTVFVIAAGHGWRVMDKHKDK